MQLRMDLNLIIISVAFGNICFYTVGGSAFTGFTEKLGANDFFYGLMVAIPMLGNLFQFVAAWLLSKTRNRRLVMIYMGFPGRAIWLLVGLIPFVMHGMGSEIQMWMVVLFNTIYAISGAFINVGYMSWISDIVPLNIRGRFLGLRSSLSTVIGFTISMLISVFLDWNDGFVSYAIVWGLAAFGGCMDIGLYLKITNVPFAEPPRTESFVKSLKEVFTNMGFYKYTFFWVLWGFSWNLAGPYYMRYALTVVGLSFVMVTLCGSVAQGVTVAIGSTLWGRALDGRGARWVLPKAYLAATLAPLFWLLASPGSPWAYLLFSVVVGIGTSGVDLVNMQRLYSAMPEKNRSLYMAAYSVICNLVGSGLGTLAGGALLDSMGDIALNIGFMTMDRYQIIFIVAAVLRISSLVFMPAMLKMSASKDMEVL